ncbi:hypothetical protein ACFL1Z_05225 [Thermodesulfobacteriota bacterium]
MEILQYDKWGDNFYQTEITKKEDLVDSLKRMLPCLLGHNREPFLFYTVSYTHIEFGLKAEF